MGTNGKENFGGEIRSDGSGEGGKALRKNGAPFLDADSSPDRIGGCIYQKERCRLGVVQFVFVFFFEFFVLGWVFGVFVACDCGGFFEVVFWIFGWMFFFGLYWFLLLAWVCSMLFFVEII